MLENVRGRLCGLRLPGRSWFQSFIESGSVPRCMEALRVRLDFVFILTKIFWIHQLFRSFCSSVNETAIWIISEWPSVLPLWHNSEGQNVFIVSFFEQLEASVRAHLSAVSEWWLFRSIVWTACATGHIYTFLCLIRAGSCSRFPVQTSG